MVWPYLIPAGSISISSGEKKLSVSRFLLVLALVVFLGFTGCGKSSKVTESPFNYNYTVDETVVTEVVEGDSIDTLVAASPFYAGAQPLPGVNAAEFDRLRREKVEEIIADADAIVQAVAAVKPEVDALSKAYVDYLDICFPEEKKLRDSVNYTLRELVAIKSRQATAQAIYDSLDTISESPLVSTYMEYTKVTRAVDLGSLYLQEVNNLLAWSALSLKALENTGNPKIRAANAALDSEMARYDQMRDRLKAVGEGMEKVAAGLCQLETADYYMAQSAVSFIEEEMPIYKEKLASLKAGEGVSEEDIALFREYMDVLEDTTRAMRARLDKADKIKLVPVSASSSVFPSAWADGKMSAMSFASSMDAIRQSGSAIPYTDQGTRSFSEAISQGWKDLKAGFQAVQHGIGVGVDTLSATTRSIMNVPVGIYYGNSVNDITDNIMQNFKEVSANFQSGTSGTGTMRTAKDYFQGAESAAQNLAEGGVASVMGDGYTSWVVGHIAKATASLFTSMGKGITTLSDPTSSAGELAVGALEIGCALSGGSKLLFQGTKAPKLAAGLGEGAGILGQKSANYLTRLAVEGGNRNLNQMLLKPVTGQIAVIGSTQQALLAALRKTNEQLTKRLAELARQGITGWASGAKDTLKSSLHDFVQKQFQANMKGFIDAVSTALGKSAGDYINNVVGEMADDYLKTMVQNALDSQPDHDGSYRGSISSPGIPGTLVMEISGQSVSGKITGSYTSKSGEFYTAKNVPFTASIKGTLTPSGEDSASIKCSLSGSMRDKEGGTYTFKGQFSGSVRNGRASGNWNASNEWGSHSGSWNASL